MTAYNDDDVEVGMPATIREHRSGVAGPDPIDILVSHPATVIDLVRQSDGLVTSVTIRDERTGAIEQWDRSALRSRMPVFFGSPFRRAYGDRSHHRPWITILLGQRVNDASPPSRT